jgi:hypothetical protein
MFDNQRNQWKSSDTLQWLSDKYKKFYSKERRTTIKILAIDDFKESISEDRIFKDTISARRYLKKWCIIGEAA